jgi:hypothetical protein
MLTALMPSRLGRLGRGFAFQDLHASFVIAADHQTAFLVGLQCGDVEVAKCLRFGVKVLVVAVEPILALVRLEVKRSFTLICM